MIDKLFVKQWTIGLAKGTQDDILNNQLSSLPFKWIELPDPETFIADPFVFEFPSGEIHLLAEHIQQPYHGKLIAYRFNQNLELIEEKIILNTGKHLSYPFIQEDNGCYFIIPESAADNGVYAYPYDPVLMKVGDPITLISDQALIDSTLVFHKNNWWLFATKKGKSSNSELHIYYSQNWKGPYFPHSNNPVKCDEDGSRPAGRIFENNGKLYRPAQNCKQYYGKSITLFNINTLSKDEYDETPIFEIKPYLHKKYNYGIHTINHSDNIIVVDCLKKSFNPLIQIKLFTKKIVTRIANHQKNKNRKTAV